MGKKSDEMTGSAGYEESYVIRMGERRSGDGGHVPNAVPVQPTNQSHPASAEDPEHIRQEMSRTRAEMSQTINAIQNRLDPAVLKEHAVDILKEAGDQAKGVIREAREQAQDAVQDATHQAKQAVREATVGRAENMINTASESAREASTGLWDTIRNNPIPAGMIGIGLGWLLMGGQSSSQRRGYSREHYYATSEARYGVRPSGYAQGYSGEMARPVQERVGDVAHDARTRARDVADDAQTVVGEATHRARETVSSATHQVGDTVGSATRQVGDAVSGVADVAQGTMEDVAEQARYQAWQARSGLEEMLETNPLAVGAIAFGVGAAIGLLAPSTRPEQEWMGETRDQLMHQAQETIHEAQEKVQTVVAEAGIAAKEAAMDEAKSQGLAPKSGA